MAKPSGWVAANIRWSILTMLEALPEAVYGALRRESIYLWHYMSIQFEQIFGYYVLGVVLGSLISVFGKDKILRLPVDMRSRGKGAKGMTGMSGISGMTGIYALSGASGIFTASVIGVASPLCMYGTIPIAASFSEKGLKDDWLAAFMMCSILLNPQLIMYSAALGATALAVRIASCFVCGLLAGVCVRLAYVNRGKGFFRFTSFAERSAEGNADASNSTASNADASNAARASADTNVFIKLLKNILRNIKVTGLYFVIGIILSAAFQRYVPESVMVNLFGNNRAFGTLMAATIGVPLYVCGGGTIPLLQGWLAGGMSMGAAAAFMVSGPSTKITNLGAVKIVLGAKNFALYIAFIMLYATLIGLLTNMLI